MLTNPRDAFSGQSRSPNIVRFHMLGIVSSCATVILFLRLTVFFDIRLQNAVTLKTGLGDVTMWWSAYDFLLTSYSNCDSISCRFWDIRYRKMSWPWNPGQRSLKVIESGTILWNVYGFLLVFLSTFVPKTHRFWGIRLGSIQWPWNLGFGSVKVIKNDAIRSGTHDFLLTFHSNYRPISHRFRDSLNFRRKSPIFPPQCIYSPRWTDSPWN